MIINYTEMYYKNVQNFRAELRKIWSDYEKTMKRIEPYKGSAGYVEEVKKSERERDTAIIEAQERAGREFSQIIAGMKATAIAQQIKAPTADEINTLSVLRMRESISRDELKQAYTAMKESPLCLSVLDEIANKFEYHGLTAGRESTADIISHIDALADSAKRLCRLDKADSRIEQIKRASPYNPDYRPGATYSLAVDRDFENADACIAFMGNVKDIESFQKAVCK